MTTLRKPLEAAARRAIAARTESLFRASGALREGHFVLKSGRHSDAYLEKFQVLQDPAATSELCAFFAAANRHEDETAAVDLVAGPTTGGVILAFETGRQLGTRAIFADPTLPVRLVDELAGECRRRGLSSHHELVGTALPRKPGTPSAKGVEYRP